jgi:hypothetical protein
VINGRRRRKTIHLKLRNAGATFATANRRG